MIDSKEIIRVGRGLYSKDTLSIKKTTNDEAEDTLKNDIYSILSKIEDELKKYKIHTILGEKHVMKQDFLHLKAPGNWINDPNGFIYYEGKYHLFYQHFPYAPMWGTMHWGHAVSTDLVQWQHEKIALFPTKNYDRNGVFSGSALEKDGKMYLYYTANRYLKEQDENIHVADGGYEESQAMIISEDGFHFDNWNGKKQIIPAVRDDEIADSMDTRDPKVWEENGVYYMILGSTYRHETGRVILYSSPDGENWSYLSQCRMENYGYMIECPDLFEVNGYRIFTGCPVTPLKCGDEVEYVAVSGYCFADFNTETGKLMLEDNYSLIDYGGDFYAQQSNLDEEGRRVMIGWMRMPKAVEEIIPWNGMMSLPRVVEVQDGKVRFRVHPNVRRGLLEKSFSRKIPESREPFCIKKTFHEGDWLNIGGYQISMEKGAICTDRSLVFTHIDSKKLHCTIPYGGEKAELEIFVEPNLIEIFVNDGEYVLSNVVYELQREIQGEIYTIFGY